VVAMEASFLAAAFTAAVEQQLPADTTFTVTCQNDRDAELSVYEE